MASDTTFYTCIESGRLEPEVVLMAKTLRAFGGRFAAAPLLAVRSRPGPSLARSTLQALQQLGVSVVERPLPHRFDWLGFTCKPLAAVVADEHAKTQYIAWLDGDVCVVKQPSALEAPEHDAHEVLACVEELGPVSTGPGDRFEPFWAALAHGAGIGIDGLPLVTSGPSGKRVRLHFNSGVFRFRRGSGFAAHYRDLFDKLFALRVIPKHDPSIFLHEQIIFSVAAATWRGGFAALEPNYNFHTEPMYETLYPPQRYGDAVLLHWHGSLRMPEFTGTFVERLQAQLPALAAVVQRELPLTAPSALPQRLHRALLRRWRLRKEAAFMRETVRV